MSNSVVTVLCVAAICCQMEERPDWAGGILFIAFMLAAWHNVQWARVFKAIVEIAARRK
jgi:hypothetical protein